MALALIGPPAAGKSRVGKKVASLLGTTHRDTDAMIVAEHGSVAEIFAEHGEEQFRRWEVLAVAEALATAGVVSLGGGAVTRPETRRALRDHRVVLLLVSESAVASRLRGNTSRPLTADLDTWRALVTERMPLYEQLADFTIDTSRRPMSRAAESVAAWAEHDARKAD